jgi:hypothetical protein
VQHRDHPPLPIFFLAWLGSPDLANHLLVCMVVDMVDLYKWSCVDRRWQPDAAGVTLDEARRRGGLLPRPAPVKNLTPATILKKEAKRRLAARVVERAAAREVEAARRLRLAAAAAVAVVKAREAKRAASRERARAKAKRYFAAWYSINRASVADRRRRQREAARV